MVPGGDPPKGRRKKKRCTKLEKLYRIRQLMTMAKAGYSIGELEDWGMKQWDLTRESMRAYTQEMLNSCVDAVSVFDKQRIAALTLVRFEHAYRLALKNKDPGAMVAANAQIAKYWVHAAPEVVHPPDPGSGEPDPEEAF
jgi:hypothetical protein